LKTQLFDIVLTDIHMPEMDGFALLKEINVISPDTEVIIITGKGSEEAAIQALRLNAFDYFKKPIMFEDLLLSIWRTKKYHQLKLDKKRSEWQIEKIKDETVNLIG